MFVVGLERLILRHLFALPMLVPLKADLHMPGNAQKNAAHMNNHDPEWE